MKPVHSWRLNFADPPRREVRGMSPPRGWVNKGALAPRMSASSALHRPVLGFSHGERARKPYWPRTRGRDPGLRPPGGGLAVGDRGPRRARDGSPRGPLGRRRSLRARGGLVPGPARAREGGVCGRRRRVPSGVAPLRGHHASAGAGLTEWARPGNCGAYAREAAFGAKSTERPFHALR
jgi:hypothetical protein